MTPRAFCKQIDEVEQEHRLVEEANDVRHHKRCKAGVRQFHGQCQNAGAENAGDNDEKRRKVVENASRIG
jgi:hypothetical protein